jgi:hypothetical protein
LVGKMTIYKVFYKNYERKRTELMGILIERRKDLRGMTQVASGLRWASLTFAHDETEEPMKLLAALLTLDTIILALDIMVLLVSFY